MEHSSLAAAPPNIPRRSRGERELGQHVVVDQSSPDRSRRSYLSRASASAGAKSRRDRDYHDVFADWSSRDRERYADRYLRDKKEDDRDRVGPLAPASPEVISSLITSLSTISRPVSNHFDGPAYLSPIGPGSPLSVSFPGSPISGSFGVDYGAYSKPSLNQLREEEDVPLEDLAASPPVVRTSKHPSSVSSLTSPRSPKSPGIRRDSSGLRSLLSRRSSGGFSRPSSKGSVASGTESIGKLSVERTQEPLSPGGSDSQGLKKQQSYDSWGKSAARSARGLMYMSSKERLREKEAEKKRSSVGTLNGNANRLSSSSIAPPPHHDPLSADSIINEESHADYSVGQYHNTPLEGPIDTTNPRLIPTRDSSLRKSKRSSARISRSSKRDSEGAYGTIPELEEHPQGSRSDPAKRRQPKNHGLAPLNLAPASPHEQHSGTFAPAPTPHHHAATSGPSTPAAAMFPDTDPVDEGAPSPAVAQGRRRDREASADYQRRSGRLTPDPFSGYNSDGGGAGGPTVKKKRSSARLKRLSGAASQAPDNSGELGVEVKNKRHSDQPTVAYERPQSADSVDDAVERYLCSPRLTQKIKHPQTGRVISFSEVGDPDGSAVFCCVGMGLTRYITAFYDELALTLKLRLITPDRPGVGDSEAYADGTTTPLSWPDDVYAICQALKITKFSILAHSAGAIYALATALRMPQHIRGRIHLLAPWIPPSQMNVVGASEKTPLPPTNAIPTSQRILRALPTPILKAANSSFMTATSSSITSSLPKQKRTKRDKKGTTKENKDQPRGMFHSLDNNNKENLNDGTADGNYTTSRPTDDDQLHQTRTQDGDVPTNGSIPNTIGVGHTPQHRRSNSSQQKPFRRTSEEPIFSSAATLASTQAAERERQELYDNRLTHAIWQLATTGANPAVDLLVCLERRHTIGFRYVDITRPVVIHHGSRDTRVPVDNVRWLGKTMRRCEVRVLEGESHGLMASAQVMGGVLMEISREWEEWSRVTGATKRDGERVRRNTIGQR
ncbi:uncharacterized protein C8A04DRAFT_30609 [Dichotomopilus funicola]|uniref:AB hydrolase-1 domain-containing protein n=1 Tax=Dichotomopilus funicola TaxID=1934379 RepID=A0AAN6V0B7_9PEZI|nr:hypothetical protein C8A04DRAFT_30609 [Dichotomopilus funicola]